jgi:hypothetical protein
MRICVFSPMAAANLSNHRRRESNAAHGAEVGHGSSQAGYEFQPDPTRNMMQKFAGQHR